jgi:ABC-type transport system involved in multi-copper enzyme maturation permease subunit
MIPAISFPKLTLVELRKMVDTRAGFWLQVATALITVAAVVIVGIVGDPPDIALTSMLSVAVAPATILLPIIGILLVTSEWTQRTALITFALVPRRMRVVNAKVAAGLVLGLIVFVIAMLVAVLATAVFGGEFELGAAVFGQTALVVLTGMLIGIAFGAALLNSAPAIVLYFALPAALGVLGAFKFFDPIADWVDLGRTQTPLMEHAASGTEWAQFLVSLLLWLGLPLAIGIYRIARGEIRS